MENIERSGTLNITGDLNLPTLHWPSRNMTGGASQDQHKAQSLMKLMDDFFLEQVILQPTGKDNILDLVMVNNYNCHKDDYF